MGGKDWARKLLLLAATMLERAVRRPDTKGDLCCPESRFGGAQTGKIESEERLMLQSEAGGQRAR